MYFRIAQYVVEQPRCITQPAGASAHVVATAQRRSGHGAWYLSPETERLLAEYEWPGNFRQFVSTLRALLVLSENGSSVPPSALPPEIRTAMPLEPDNFAAECVDPLDAQMLSAMRTALEASGGNVSQAARRLGIDRSTYYRRLIKKTHTRG